MTIAGSDSSGGAGAQADLKTFAALGAYGASVITAVTAQNTMGVTAVQPIDPEVVAAQIDAVLTDLPVAAVKIGMLANAAIVRVVAERLRAHAPPHVVLDPVMVATSGDPLLEPPAVQALVEALVPLAEIVTPNLPEAEVLGEISGTLLIKGGHGDGAEVVDRLIGPTVRREFRRPRVSTAHTHGTGCTLSAAIAVGLARGLSLVEAVEQAIDYVHRAISQAYPVGQGSGPVHHFWSWWQGRRDAE